MTVKIFGIRHHGQGSAKSLLKSLEKSLGMVNNNSFLKEQIEQINLLVNNNSINIKKYFIYLLTI